MNTFKKISRRAFTIIELIVVIATLTVLAAIVSANVVKYMQKARDAKLKEDFSQIERAAKLDYTQCGTWAKDTYPNEPPRFSDPDFSGVNGPNNDPGDPDYCPDVKIFYPVSDFNAEYYCQGCIFDWEVWPPDPGLDGLDCVLINLRAEDWSVLKTRCISTPGCPGCTSN